MTLAPAGARRLLTLAFAASMLALAACSPALNWRSVTLPDAGLALTLPCKPEYASRPVDLGTGAVPLAMVGCEADGATFAVSHMPLAEAAQAGAMLARWQAAVQAGMRASQPAAPVAFRRGAERSPRRAMSARAPASCRPNAFNQGPSAQVRNQS